jgi:hypothetical protein
VPPGYVRRHALQLPQVGFETVVVGGIVVGGVVVGGVVVVADVVGEGVVVVPEHDVFEYVMSR